MEESKKPSIYAVPGIPFQVQPGGKRTITKAIAEAWEIPEEKVLGSTEVVAKDHPSPYSTRTERIKEPGERHIDYVNARKFYFYVMVELERYRWAQLTRLTGRKIAAMKFASKKAQEHMRLEPTYMAKAQYVLDLIKADLILFPYRKKPKVDGTVDNRTGVHGAPLQVQSDEENTRCFD